MADSQRATAVVSPGLADVVRLLWPAASGAGAAMRWSAPALSRGPRREYVALPRPSRPTLLVPAGPRRATRTALGRASIAPSRRAKALRRAADVAVATGVAAAQRHRLVVTVEPGGRAIEDALAEVVGRPVVVGVYLGRPRANLKPVLQVMDRGGETLAFAKVGMTPLSDALVERETRALSALAGADLGPVTVPAVVAAGEWQGHPLLVQAALPVWRATGGPDAELLATAMRAVAAVGAGTRRLRDCACWHDLDTDLERLASTARGDELGAAVARLAAYADAPVASGVGHGDWTPGNTAVVDDRVLVFDWERYAEHQPAGLDALHYDLQRRLFWDVEPDAVERWSAGSADLLAAVGVDPRAAALLRATYLACVLARWQADDQPPVPGLPVRMSRALRAALDELDELDDTYGTGVAGARPE
jgi:hypothetical protein